MKVKLKFSGNIFKIENSNFDQLKLSVVLRLITNKV